MPIPEICPLDGNHECKARDCHLYHKDWRSGEYNCSIGYGTTKKTSSKVDPLQDTYAQNTRIRLGKDIQPTVQIQQTPVQKVMKTIREDKAIQKPEQNESVVEEVVISDNNTTVINSNRFAKKVDNALGLIDAAEKKKKGKSIDDAMKLDLPDDYEEKFWS